MTSYQEQKEFREGFEKKINDTIESMELACLQADKDTYAALNLTVPAGRIELWGIIIFAAHGTYFYISPSENYMTVLLRQATHDREPTEQMLNFADLADFTVSVPPRHWYSFLFNESKYRIDAACTIASTPRRFSFLTHKDAAGIAEKMKRSRKLGN